MLNLRSWMIASALLFASAGAVRAETDSTAAGAELCPMTEGARLRSALIGLHDANRDEIALGKLALDRAESSEVKQFATKMVRDHTASDKKLIELAKREKIDLTLASSQDPVRAAMGDASRTLQNTLATLRGSQFDTAYLAPQLAMHDLAINIVEQGQKVANVPNVINYLRSAHQTISEHRERVLSLQNRLTLSATPVGGGPAAAPQPSAAPTSSSSPEAPPPHP